MQSTLSSTAERVESVRNDLKKEFGEQHVWVPTAELLGPYSFIQVLFIKIVKIVQRNTFDCICSVVAFLCYHRGLSVMLEKALVDFARDKPEYIDIWVHSHPSLTKHLHCTCTFIPVPSFFMYNYDNHSLWNDTDAHCILTLNLKYLIVRCLMYELCCAIHIVVLGNW